MSISGISTKSLIASLGYLDINQSQDTDSSTSSSAVDNSSAAATYSSGKDSSSSASSISEVGSLFSSLSKLSKADPAAFKELAKQMASDLHDAADLSSNTLDSYSLNAVAAQLSNASTTGSMSSVNLSGASKSLTKGYSNSSGLNLLNYMNSSQGSSFTGQLTSVLSTNLANLANGIGS